MFHPEFVSIHFFLDCSCSGCCSYSGRATCCCYNV